MSDALQIIQRAGRVESIERIDLGDCDEVFRGAVFDVWVTPTRAHIEQRRELNQWLLRADERVAAIQRELEDIEDEDEKERIEQARIDEVEQETGRRVDAYLAKTWLNLDLDAVTKIREHLQKEFPYAFTWLIRRTAQAIEN
jgi:hypothetical protein